MMQGTRWDGVFSWKPGAVIPRPACGSLPQSIMVLGRNMLPPWSLGQSETNIINTSVYTRKQTHVDGLTSLRSDRLYVPELGLLSSFLSFLLPLSDLSWFSWWICSPSTERISGCFFSPSYYTDSDQWAISISFLKHTQLSWVNMHRCTCCASIDVTSIASSSLK